MVILENNIWLLDASRANASVPGFHCYLIKDSQGLTMIDSSLPGRGKQMLDEICELGFSVNDLKRIFLTHTDMDHIGSSRELQELTGCEVYVSEKELEYVTGIRKRLPLKAAMFEQANFAAPRLQIYPAEIEEYQIISSPGHTAGHVCILYGGCMFAGDCMSTENGKISMVEEKFCENMELAKQSFTKVSLYDFGTWCPGHGEPRRHGM